MSFFRKRDDAGWACGTILIPWALALAGCSPAAPPQMPAVSACPRPLAPVLTQADLLHAEAVGYDEGLAAGKRVQAKRDAALLAAKPAADDPADGTTASAAPVAPPAVMPPPAATPSYAPAGQAIPLH